MRTDYPGRAAFPFQTLYSLLSMQCSGGSSSTLKSLIQVLNVNGTVLSQTLKQCPISPLKRPSRNFMQTRMNSLKHDSFLGLPSLLSSVSLVYDP